MKLLFVKGSPRGEKSTSTQVRFAFCRAAGHGMKLGHFRVRENRDARSRRGYSPWSRCDWPLAPLQATA